MSLKTTTIRRGVPSDAPIIAKYNVLMAKETESLDLDVETVIQGVQAVLSDPSKGLYYCVQVEENGSTNENSNTVIGQLMITYEWSDWRNANVWWVQSVYVTPEHRKQGVFTRLYQYVKEDARRAGACGLRLYADNDNVRAQETYMKLGMTTHYAVYEDMWV